MKEEFDKKVLDEIEKRQKAIYACMVCKGMFKDPGYCPNCNIVLKRKAG